MSKEIKQQEGKVFDFTIERTAMSPETLNVYYRLRRVALLENGGHGDASKLPDGKTYTEAQVIEILGEDYAEGLVINKHCCS